MTMIAVVGFGAWGCALAAHAARFGHDVRAWALEREVVDEVNARHTNTSFLPGVTLPEGIRATSDPAEAVRGAELVILAPPSKHLRAVATLLAPSLPPEAVVAVASKGIEERSLSLMSEVLAEALPAVGDARVVFLSGPSFAREVAAGLPTDVVAASASPAAAAFVQRCLHAPTFRVYTSDDPIGVQVGGAVKNVIAIAAGACDALGLGTNARAALITRGLAEITRLGVALGADPLTFLGLAGVGDLVLTCTGALSRNRELGVKLAEGVDPREYLAGRRSVAEGFSTSAATWELARRRGVDMPIAEQVFHVLHRGRPLLDALRMLATRELKGELVGVRPRAPVAPACPIDGGDRRAWVASRVGPELQSLASLAYNLWWSWQPGGAELFRSVDPAGWEASGECPVRMLLDAPPECLARAASDADLVARAAAMNRAMQAELSRPSAPVGGATPARPVAFFCAEYGVHRSLPIYAGGLGALAGDFLKEASDRALPVVAVGLLYRRGYFRQRLDTSGWQHEYWTEQSPERLPMLPVTGGDGRPLVVRVRLRGHDVALRVWRADVGRVPLYLLDSQVDENAAVDRWITSTLYVSDRELRLLQYALLGVGGVRALAAMGVDPAVVHVNEGHAAFASLELARMGVARGAAFDEALAAARGRVVFTTHTPVAAGNEAYAAGDVLRALDDLVRELGVAPDALCALGAAPSRAGAAFGMTELALHTSRAANGVSRRHGEVARAMWRGLWPERDAGAVPIGHVTNGVHLRTWMAPAMRELLDRHLGAGWCERAADPWRWAAVERIPDEALWAVREALRAELVEYVRRRSVADRLARGEPLDYAEAAARTFDPAALTVGFARRVASYKRLHLLIGDPARALGLLRGERPLQVLIAGKAHPRDDDAKRLVQAVFALKREPQVGARVAFLEDYDLSMAARLVAGCDVWVNLPRPPLEASGTSGMKAAMNGGLNLAVLDGWWAEGFDGRNGWAIESGQGLDDAVQDARDAGRLYDLLEREVVPAFHDRDASGVPRRWVQRIKASLCTLGPRFNAGRMLSDYLARAYAPDEAAT